MALRKNTAKTHLLIALGAMLSSPLTMAAPPAAAKNPGIEPPPHSATSQKTETATKTDTKANQPVKPTPKKQRREVVGVMVDAEWGDLAHCYLKGDTDGKDYDLSGDVDYCLTFKGKRVRVVYDEYEMFFEPAGQVLPVLDIVTIHLDPKK